MTRRHLLCVLLALLGGCGKSPSPEPGTPLKLILALPASVPKGGRRYLRLRAQALHLEITAEGPGGTTRQIFPPAAWDGPLVVTLAGAADAVTLRAAIRVERAQGGSWPYPVLAGSRHLDRQELDRPAGEAVRMPLALQIPVDELDAGLRL